MRLIVGTITAMVRLVLLPFKLALAAVGFVFEAGVRVGSLPVRASGAALKAAKVRGVLLFGLGIGLGLLFAPGPGRDLRRRLVSALRHRGGLSDIDLADQIVFELGHAPRTWHLPQPGVTVDGGRVTLSGEVPHQTAHDELVRVTGAIPGVVGVDDRLVVAGVVGTVADSAGAGDLS